jgi:transposase-like protein
MQARQQVRYIKSFNYTEGDMLTLKCKKCGSDEIVKAGFAIRRGGKVQGYRCKVCGHFFIEEKKKPKQE